MDKHPNILKFKSTVDTSPLKFSDYTDIEEKEKKKFAVGVKVEKMILSVLEITKTSKSVNPELSKKYGFDYVETDNFRMRSALDIWRHIKYFRPRISLTSVMKGLYNLDKKSKLYGHFCDDVERMVFGAEKYNRVCDGYCWNEFGNLYFEYWGKL